MQNERRGPISRRRNGRAGRFYALCTGRWALRRRFDRRPKNECPALRVLVVRAAALSARSMRASLNPRFMEFQNLLREILF